jgi:hypothetical protein
MSKSKNKIISLILLLSIGLVFALCKKDDKNQKEQMGLGLLWLMQKSNQQESSGFIIKIPEGVAK